MWGYSQHFGVKLLQKPIEPEYDSECNSERNSHQNYIPVWGNYPLLVIHPFMEYTHGQWVRKNCEMRLL